MADCSIRPFTELSASEINAVYRLRSEVFIVEQNCVYNDVDEIDLISYHLLIKEGGLLLAYCRIYNIDKIYHIGRVVVKKDKRQFGLGKIVMKEALDYCKKENSQAKIEISAQSYLIRFYNEMGFKEEGEGYLEDGITHVKMKFFEL
ncbi:MAG: GNAT family N-acetyltransferase [Bacteroidetes bacterium]|nr:GNAT family N-acetyltransferase [Bacteroidota bacterium]MCA6443193.1 GNAT family N-acetyltransferase [Bacteroidota bacterium]